MRIISGILRGKKLYIPNQSEIRPTADRVKENCFNILTNYFGEFDEIRVLDCFAGTGSMGLEAYSRGAAEIIFMERSKDHLKTLSRNIQDCKSEDLKGQIQIKHRDVWKELKKMDPESYDLVLCDPPYDYNLKPIQIYHLVKVLSQSGMLVIERSRRSLPKAWEEKFQGLVDSEGQGEIKVKVERRDYGETSLLFVNRT